MLARRISFMNDIANLCKGFWVFSYPLLTKAIKEKVGFGGRSIYDPADIVVEGLPIWGIGRQLS